VSRGKMPLIWRLSTASGKACVRILRRAVHGRCTHLSVARYHACLRRRTLPWRPHGVEAISARQTGFAGNRQGRGRYEQSGCRWLVPGRFEFASSLIFIARQHLRSPARHAPRRETMRSDLGDRLGRQVPSRRAGSTGPTRRAPSRSAGAFGAGGSAKRVRVAWVGRAPAVARQRVLL